MNQEAIISALEQARSALDAVEANMSQARKMPKPAVEAAPEGDKPLTCPECGKPMGECDCAGEDDAAEME